MIKWIKNFYPFVLGNPKSTFANCTHRWNAAFNQSLNCKGKKDIQTKECNLFKIYNLTLLDMYNKQFQIYSIKPEGRIH